MEQPRADRHRSGSRRLPRIAIGGILHETNTFAPGVTTLADFAERSLLRGQDMIDAARGTASSPGGVIEFAEGEATLVPTLFASAMPGGPVEDASFEALAGDLVNRLRVARRTWPGIDGVILFLHGAMVTQSDDDADGEFLARVRDEVSADCPVVVVVDSHANVSARMVEQADMLVGFQKYPHTDTKERGIEALAHCLSLAHNQNRPVAVLRKVPILSSLLSQRTEEGTAMDGLWGNAHDWRALRSIASISLIPGFPYADVPDAGASVLVYAWDYPPFRADATRAADDLAAAWWAERDRFRQQGVSLADVPTALRGLTVLAEVSDNPGASGMGDGTHLLRWLIDEDCRNAAFATIFDPDAVSICHQAGLGATVQLAIGGRRHPTSGLPVERNWTIDHLGDGVFANEGAMATGTVSRIGRTATLRTGTISVILSERRTQSLDPSVFRAGGIEPERCHWLAVKSSVHYRAGFGTLASTMIDVECPGLSPSDLRSLMYSRITRPIYPLDAMGDEHAASMGGPSDA